MGKTLKKAALLLIPAFSLLSGIISCNDSGCMDNRSSIPLAQFYNEEKKSEQLQLDSVTIFGIGQKNDSLLLDSANSVTRINLPFRNSNDTTRFVIRYNIKANVNHQYDDTLTFIYRSYPYFASIECGSMFNYIIDKYEYTTHTLVSMEVVAPEINNQNNENIRLYYYAKSNN